ncbi:hypothetical protein PDJ86_22330 [Bacillus cereus group sp. TH36-2LC]|uniref:hypothetical protein n=1 Tax=Bacillus cereus group sp. TH36-2LC TaxID=3018040 RepID=UPI0022E67805|nr:hypothetical protein [Bacillus cereus group sp. TH36-2LC]MDA1509597.1 hypothetical protein [Bacillus cereus group sp. TH36-2LC]
MKKVQGLVIREGATLTAGEKVEVYYNIQKGGFSIVSKDKNNPMKNKVVAYADYVTIENASFHINEKKHAKIIEMQRKTVYAVVRGEFLNADSIDNSEHKKGYCNPYTTGKFIDWDTKEEIKTASQVHFYDKFFSFTN